MHVAGGPCRRRVRAGKRRNGPGLPPVPVCIYNSRSFSDGAHLCFQKYLMMICSTDNNRPVWKIVTDKDLNRYCLNPINVTDE